MSRILILISILVCLSATAMGQINQTDDCEITKPSRDVSKAIRNWLEDSQSSRSWDGASELRAMLENPDINCRDRAELDHAFYILDLRDESSESSMVSAEFILDHPDRFDSDARQKAMFVLMDTYKFEKRYSDLALLSQRPVVKESSSTLIAARNAFVVSSFALRGTEPTLEMLRPMAEQPVNVRDWWLMHFANALAERSGESELADVFLTKANEVLVPTRPMKFPVDLSGDKADKMLALYSMPIPEEKTNWEMMRHPIPDYPNAAVSKGLNGICDIVFDISAEGKPENIRAYCSSKQFIKSARRALTSVRFRHKLGSPEPVQDVVYPLEYTIAR